jgi:hypothetical protein
MLSANQPDQRCSSISLGVARTRRAQALRPSRTRRGDLVPRRRSNVDDPEAVRLERRDSPGGEPIASGRDAAQAVAHRRGEQELEPSVRCNEPGDTSRYHRIQADDTAEQGAPREPDGHQRCQAGKLGRWRLGGGEDESYVRESALTRRPGGTTGGLGHRRRIGVEAEGEGGRLPGGRDEDRSTVTGADVDRHPLVAGNKFGELADVHLDEATSDDEANHARQDTRPGQRRAATAN